MNRVSSHWWMIVARGATSFALAAFLLLGPEWSSMQVVAMAFGIFALLDGAGALAFVFGARDIETSTYVGRGALGIGTGALLLALPPSGMPGLFLVAAIWGIGTGGLELAFGSRTWFKVPKALGFMLEGTLCVGFGLTALCFQHESAATLRAFLAAYAVMNGIAAVALGEGMHGPVETAGQVAGAR